MATSARRTSCVGPDGPVFLDAECAWWGDPAFDLAFCLNHLLLKCLWMSARPGGLLACFDAMAKTYLRGVTWEDAGALGVRAAGLLPGLLLARVDGKSPVEYIDRRGRSEDRVRRGRAGAAGGAASAAGSARCRDAAWRDRNGAAMSDDARSSIVHGRRVWDSRGRPTVEADVMLGGGAVGRAIAPAGASTGSGEALDLRDGGPRSAATTSRGGSACQRHHRRTRWSAGRGRPGGAGRTADRAGRHARQDAPGRQRDLSVSMAAAHAAAAAAGQPLYRYLGGPDAALMPLPQIQIFGGGAHAGRRVDIQDFMVVCPAAAFRPGAGLDRRGLPRRRAADGTRPAIGPASPTRAAGGQCSPPTRRRWRRWSAPSNAPASSPASR